MIDRCARSRRKREGISEINSDFGRSNSFSLEIPSGLRLFISPIITIIISRERSSALANPEEGGRSSRRLVARSLLRAADPPSRCKAPRRSFHGHLVTRNTSLIPRARPSPRAPRGLRVRDISSPRSRRARSIPFTIRAASRGGMDSPPPPLHFPASRARIISPRAFIRIIRRC